MFRVSFVNVNQNFFNSSLILFQSSGNEPLEWTSEFFHLSIVHSLGCILVLRPNTLGNLIAPDLLWVFSVKSVFMIELVPLPGEELAVPPGLLVSEVEELVTELTGVERSEELEVGNPDELSTKFLGRCPAKDRIDNGALLYGLQLLVPHLLAFVAICISSGLTSIRELYLALVDKFVGELDILILNLVAIHVILRNREDCRAEGPVIRLNHLLLDCGNFNSVCLGVELWHLI